MTRCPHFPNAQAAAVLPFACVFPTGGCKKPPPLPTGKIFDCAPLSCEWGWDPRANSLPLAERGKHRKTGQVAGIDSGRIVYVTDPLRDGVRKGDVYVAVWADINGGFGRTVTRTPGAETVCEMTIDDYLRVHNMKFVYRTKDGKGGTLEAGGQKFDVAKGRLLLVSSRGGTLRFKQLDRPGLNVAGARQGVIPQTFAALRTDAEIVGFFTREKARAGK